MKKITALLICVLFLSGCNLKLDLGFEESEQTLSTISDSSTPAKVEVSSKNINIKTEIYEAKNQTTYNKDLIFPKTAYNSIPEEDYIYYSSLSNNMKKLYKKLCGAIEGMADGFVDLGKISDDNIALLITCIKSDHPEYFWLGRDYITNTKQNGEKQLAFKFKNKDYSFNYLLSVDNRNKILNNIKNILTNLESKVLNKTEYERELVIHNYITSNCVYDDAAVDNSDAKPHAYNVYGALIQKTAVCEGYARAIQLVNNHFGIKTTVIFGTANGGNHMWNLVRIDNEYYHLDATFNDSGNQNLYSYFNISEEILLRTHKFDKDLYSKISFPKADSMSQSYFANNNSLLCSDLSKEVYDGLDNAVKFGKTSLDFGYNGGVNTIPKNNNELLNNNIDVLYYLSRIAKNRNVKIIDISITFASNGNFKVSWTYK